MGEILTKAENGTKGILPGVLQLNLQYYEIVKLALLLAKVIVILLLLQA